jgi:S-disulfanyl-L-cysteine oxidoreductase SoxD
MDELPVTPLLVPHPPTIGSQHLQYIADFHEVSLDYTEGVKRALAILTSAAVTLIAQNAVTVRGGAYTADQATAGEAAYKADCASCHGAELEGSGRNTPPLVGEEFLAGWRELPVGDLFDKIQEAMPADKPGTLPRDRNAQILAFMMKRNGYPAGATALPTSATALAKIEWGPRR